MEYKKIDSVYIIRLKKGEEIIKSLLSICNKEKIKFGKISGIGALSSVTMGYYELLSKTYFWEEFQGDLEVTSLQGNISLLDKKSFIHIHLNISDNFEVRGGHLKEGIVGATLEIFIETMQGKVERKLNKEIGLNLLDLS